MNEYVEVYRALRLPEGALAVFTADISLPIYAVVPPEDYGFPPALVPMWSRDNPSYVGYWKHWFTERPGTYVQMYIDGGRRADEIARSFDQLVRAVVLESVTEDEGVVPRTRTFASRVGISEEELEQIDAISAETGDELSGLLTLDAFASDAPRRIADEAGGEYNGRFPSVARPDSLRHSCDLEVPPNSRASIAPEGVPPWYGVQDQRPVFQELLDRGDLEGAWFSLNSSGWAFAEAKQAITDLRDQARKTGEVEAGFEAVVDAWLAQPHEKAGSF